MSSSRKKSGKEFQENHSRSEKKRLERRPANGLETIIRAMTMLIFGCQISTRTFRAAQSSIRLRNSIERALPNNSTLKACVTEMVEAANKQLANLRPKDRPNRKSIQIDRIKETPFKRAIA